MIPFNHEQLLPKKGKDGQDVVFNSELTVQHGAIGTVRSIRNNVAEVEWNQGFESTFHDLPEAEKPEDSDGKWELRAQTAPADILHLSDSGAEWEALLRQYVAGMRKGDDDLTQERINEKVAAVRKSIVAQIQEDADMISMETFWEWGRGKFWYLVYNTCCVRLCRRHKKDEKGDLVGSDTHVALLEKARTQRLEKARTQRQKTLLPTYLQSEPVQREARLPTLPGGDAEAARGIAEPFSKPREAISGDTEAARGKAEPRSEPLLQPQEVQQEDRDPRTIAWKGEGAGQNAPNRAF